MLRLKARCIDEQVLCIISRQNAHDSVTSRLGLLAGNADLFTDQRVDQRALADVRTADHSNTTLRKSSDFPVSLFSLINLAFQISNGFAIQSFLSCILFCLTARLAHARQ